MAREASPQWNDIEAFLRIARAGQVARAAMGSGVDATTLARRLRRLEAVLGSTLFEQTREGQVLTEAGERLLASAETMQRAAEDIAGAADPRGGVSGLLRVSASEGFGTWFIAHHLAQFAARHPRLTIDLAATSGFLSPSKRETDVAILLARPRAGPVVAGKLTDYRLYLYAARRFLERTGPVETIDALTRAPLVGYIPDLLYAPELRYLGEVDARLTPSVRSSSINAQYRIIASGGGIGVLPGFIGDRDDALVRVLPDRSITRSFWIVTHRDTRQLERVRLFRDWLVDMVAAQRQRFVE